MSEYQLHGLLSDDRSHARISCGTVGAPVQRTTSTGTSTVVSEVANTTRLPHSQISGRRTQRDRRSGSDEPVDGLSRPTTASAAGWSEICTTEFNRA